MSVIIYINDVLVETYAGTNIAQTKRVEDIYNLTGRYSSYTNNFKIPKTANNLQMVDFMTVTGNSSNIPYQKNKCRVYSGETGECMVKDGWAVISDDGESFNVFIADGAVDFYKAIENTTLADVVGNSLNHTKSVSLVKATWAGIAPYMYIVADFNGKMQNDAGDVLYIEHLVPAVRIEYLWQNIFIYHGFDYSGNVFDTQAFKNLYMTFPKGLETVATTNFESSDCDANTFVSSNRYAVEYLSTDVNELEEIIDDKWLRVPVDGNYRIRVTGHLKGKTGFDTPVPTKIFIGRNGENIPGANIAQFSVLGIFDYDTDIDETVTFSLSAHDTICVIITDGVPDETFIDILESLEGADTLSVELSILEPSDINFEEAFSDFSVKDFVSEIVQRFGLGVFIDKNTGVYNYLTLQERLQNTDVIDWSKKFSRKISENYILNSYAITNWFRYNYNDKESTHNDGYITVNNANLEDKKDLFKSKVYSPERIGSTLLNSEYNVYKLFDKDVKETDGETVITYKPLDKRYFFMRAQRVDASITLQSFETMESDTDVRYYRESFYKLPFQDIIQDYYTPISRVLNKVIVVTAEIMLNDIDVANFDFTRMIYIDKLSNYFIVNKIENYISGKPTKCELVRVIYAE